MDRRQNDRSERGEALLQQIRDLRQQEARARRLAWEQPQRDTQDTLEHYAEELREEAAHLERLMHGASDTRANDDDAHEAASAAND